MASLIYLARQTRSNSRSLKANAIWNAETIFGEINYSHASNPELAELLSRGLSPDARPEDFSATEISQLQFTARGALQYFQAQWSLWREGMLPDEIWERRRTFARGFVDLPVINEIWKAEIQQHVIADEFRRDIEAVERASAVSIGLAQSGADK